MPFVCHILSVVVSDGTEPSAFPMSAFQCLQRIDVLAGLSIPPVSLQKPRQLEGNGARRNTGKGLCGNRKKSMWLSPVLWALLSPCIQIEHLALIMMPCLGEILPASPEPLLGRQPRMAGVRGMLCLVPNLSTWGRQGPRAGCDACLSDNPLKQQGKADYEVCSWLVDTWHMCRGAEEERLICPLRPHQGCSPRYPRTRLCAANAVAKLSSTSSMQDQDL